MQPQKDEKILLRPGDRLVFTKTSEGMFTLHAETPEGVHLGPWVTGLPTSISAAASQAAETYE
jgi:hypothetical protein